MNLTDLRPAFDRDGFVVVPGFKPPAALQALRQRAQEIVAGFDPAEPGARSGVFSSVHQQLTSDDWFLGSGDRVRCFFEEEAFDGEGRLNRPLPQAINKIGHALHDLDPVFDAFSRGPELAAIAGLLGMRDPVLMQSMLIFKQPAIGGEVRWHQDATYLLTRPEKVLGLWFALEDADRDNGCLWVQPGGHRGPLRERFVRDGTGSAGGVRLERIDPTPWPTDNQALPLEVSAGSLVIFDGRLPHYSAPNRSPRSRLAYTLHAVEAEAEWLPENWLQRDAALPLRGF
jgi:phytanoyl-CoA hydroxylase